MSYTRKFHSQAGIPFSWEDKPGISKFVLQEMPRDAKSHVQKLDVPLPLSQPSYQSEKPKVLAQEAKLPLPPCRNMLSWQRSSSLKGFRLEEDPFFIAYEKCTRSVKHEKSRPHKDVGSGARKRSLSISCKNSCDVRDGSFVRVSKVPSLPQDIITKAKYLSFN